MVLAHMTSLIPLLCKEGRRGGREHQGSGDPGYQETLAVPPPACSAFASPSTPPNLPLQRGGKKGRERTRLLSSGQADPAGTANKAFRQLAKPVSEKLFHVEHRDGRTPLNG